MLPAELLNDRLCFSIASPDVTKMPIAWTGETESICRTLSHVGYRGVEVQVRDPAGFDTLAFTTTLAKYGITLVSLSTGPAAHDSLVIASNDPSIRQATLDRLKTIADFAADQGASVAIGSIRGSSHTAGSIERAKELLHDSLVILGAHVAGSGIRWLIEPQSRSITDLLTTVEDTLHLIDDIPVDQVGIEFDTFHALNEEDNILNALTTAQNSGRLQHVQVADSNRKVPGDGQLNWRELLTHLADIGYEGWLSVEVSHDEPSSTIAKRARSQLIQAVDR